MVVVEGDGEVAWVVVKTVVGGEYVVVDKGGSSGFTVGCGCGWTQGTIGLTVGLVFFIL